VLIAHILGILKRAIKPFPEVWHILEDQQD